MPASKPVVKPLKQAVSCRHCGNITKTLLKCGACGLVHYCSREHQLADWKGGHKHFCMVVNGAETVRKNQANTVLEFNYVWEGQPIDPYGRFNDFLPTHEYLLCRVSLLNAMSLIDTRESIEAQINSLQELLELDRADGLGLRAMVPGRLVRLGRDQEAYDFIKWYSTTAYTYNVKDVYDKRFQDTKNADPFEFISWAFQCVTEPSHVVILALLKLRILLDLQSVGTAYKLSKKMGKVVKPKLRSQIVADSKTLLEREDHGDDVRMLLLQIEDLIIFSTEVINKLFWPALLEPDPDNLKPYTTIMDSPRTVSGMRIMMRHAYRAWVETPTAIAWLRERSADKAGRLAPYLKPLEDEPRRSNSTVAKGKGAV